MAKKVKRLDANSKSQPTKPNTKPSTDTQTQPSQTTKRQVVSGKANADLDEQAALSKVSSGVVKVIKEPRSEETQYSVYNMIFWIAIIIPFAIHVYTSVSSYLLNSASTPVPSIEHTIFNNITQAMPEYWPRDTPLAETLRGTQTPYFLSDTFVNDWKAMQWSYHPDFLDRLPRSTRVYVSSTPTFARRPSRRPFSTLGLNITGPTRVFKTVRKASENKDTPYIHSISSIKTSPLRHEIGYTPPLRAELQVPTMMSIVASNSTPEVIAEKLQQRETLIAKNAQVHPSYYGTWREFVPKIHGQETNVHTLTKDSVLPLTAQPQVKWLVAVDGRIRVYLVSPMDFQSLQPYPWVHPLHTYASKDLFASTDSHTNATLVYVDMLPGQLLHIPEQWAYQIQALANSVFLEFSYNSPSKMVLEHTYGHTVSALESRWTQAQRNTVASLIYQGLLHNTDVLKYLPDFTSYTPKPLMDLEENPEYEVVTSLDGRKVNYVLKNATEAEKTQARVHSAQFFLNFTLPAITTPTPIDELPLVPSREYYHKYIAPIYNPIYTLLPQFDITNITKRAVLQPDANRNAAYVDTERQMDLLRAPAMVWVPSYKDCNIDPFIVLAEEQFSKKEDFDMLKAMRLLPADLDPEREPITDTHLYSSIIRLLEKTVEKFLDMEPLVYPIYLREFVERIAYWATNHELNGALVPKTIYCMAYTLYEF